MYWGFPQNKMWVPPQLNLQKNMLKTEITISIHKKQQIIHSLWKLRCLKVHFIDKADESR